MISVTAWDDEGLPSSVSEIMEWVTSSHEERLNIPEFLCSSHQLFARGESPAENPDVLQASALGSMQGVCWLAFMLEHFRSERSFASRLAAILERSGIQSRHVAASHSKEDLLAQRREHATAVGVVDWDDAVLMSENVESAQGEAAFEACGVAMFGLRTAEELAGRRALALADTFGVHWSVCQDPQWVYFYSRCQRPYARVCAFYQRQLINSHTEELSCGSLAEQFALLRQFFRAVLGTDLERNIHTRTVMDGGKQHRFAGSACEWLANNASLFVRHFRAKDHCRYTSKLCKQLAEKAASNDTEPLQAKAVHTFMNSALKFMGVSCEAVYRSASRKAPVSYKLRWVWTRAIKVDGETLEPPTPHPAHPLQSGWQLQRGRLPALESPNAPHFQAQEESKNDPEASQDAEMVDFTDQPQPSQSDTSLLPPMTRSASGGLVLPSSGASSVSLLVPSQASTPHSPVCHVVRVCWMLID